MRRTKSLRQLARELGVSASYLSQIRHGKCRASPELLSKLDSKTLSMLSRNEQPVDVGTCSVYNDEARGRMSPGGLRGLQIRRGA